jgi:hypothetical protein
MGRVTVKLIHNPVFLRLCWTRETERNAVQFYPTELRITGDPAKIRTGAIRLSIKDLHHSMPRDERTLPPPLLDA